MNNNTSITVIRGKLSITYPLNEDSELINDFIEKISNKFCSIQNYFNVAYDVLKLNLYQKVDFDKFIAKTTTQFGNEDNIPNWLVGFSVDGNVYIVIPSQDKLDYMTKVAIHELVHQLSYKIPYKEKRTKLLEEGVACFLADQISEKRFQTIIDDYNNNTLHKLSDFCIYNGNEFGKLNGYAYSYVIIEFLNKTFGKDKILYWLEYPEKFLQIVPTIENDFRQYLTNKINKK